MTVLGAAATMPLTGNGARPYGSGWLAPAWKLAGVYLVLSSLLRLLLWARFGVADSVPVSILPEIFAVGLINDSVQLVYLLLPLTLFLVIFPQAHRGWPRRLLALGLWTMLVGMLFVGASEYFFFEEFDSRFNLVAVDYLIYPTEVIGDIGDEYPVAPLLLAFAALAALATRLMLRQPAGRPLLQRQPARAVRVAALFAHLLGIATVTLFWTAQTLSPFANRAANELAANGPARFFAAFNNNHIDYPVFYRTGETRHLLQELADDLTPGGGEFVDLAAGDVTRRFAADSAGLGKLNVVMVVEESLGAEFVGAYGATRGLTPNFDRLARDGVLFTHAFATGTRTVRGLEALTASFPPIPSESIIKRKGNQGIATWGKTMNALGYRSSFLYGGYGAFDNMNPYFRDNGFAISDRSEIRNPQFANIWGVSDEDLFRHAVRYFDAEARSGQPFFSVIMTTSNHKPFSFPEGVDGVKARGGGRSAGARYADHALGQFVEAARHRPWFGDTLFVFVADHDARVYGKANLPLNTYEIPLLLYAPQHLPPGRVDTLTSQIDVAPTVLGLLGLPYQAPFFGQNVLDWPTDRPRTLLFNHNHDVAALSGNHLCILGLRKTAHCERYRRTPGAPGEATTHFEPIADDAALIELATAYYQTAYELFTEQRYR